MALTSTAYFMVVLDSSVLITALPRMQRDLHVGLSSLQWTFNAYGIAFAAGIITAAALGDRFGRRRVFNSGLALFTIASAACALAPGAGELIAARTVQGLAGAVVLPLSLTILTTAFPAEKRGMIVGVYGGLAGLAVALGPIVGGARHRSDRLALDLLAQRADRRRRRAARRCACCPRATAQPERLDLVGGGSGHRRASSRWCGRSPAPTTIGWSSAETIAAFAAGVRAARGVPRLGETRAASRWCRCGCSRSASSRSAT